MVAELIFCIFILKIVFFTNEEVRNNSPGIGQIKE
jgi:hypothetical protein